MKVVSIGFASLSLDRCPELLHRLAGKEKSISDVRKCSKLFLPFLKGLIIIFVANLRIISDTAKIFSLKGATLLRSRRKTPYFIAADSTTCPCSGKYSKIWGYIQSRVPSPIS